MSKLIDRIDRTREAWSNELKVCRNELLDTLVFENPLSRLVVELDYLLVEAKIALEDDDVTIARLLSESALARNRLRLPKHIQEGR